MDCLGDLRWAIEGPPLWGSYPPKFEHWLRASESLWPQLASAPAQLDSRLSAHRRAPIGRYFERLYGYWLSQIADIENMHQNVTIQGPNGTLGELDVVFQSQGVSYHWELALKYYLGVGDLSDAANWHGPRGRDRLDKKLAKLVDKQLRLPEKAAVRQHLATLGIGEISSHAVVKGYLFYPFTEWRALTAPRPNGIHPSHDRGWWLTLAQLDDALAMPASGWRILAKPDWIGPCTGPAELSVDRLREVLTAQVSQRGSTMIAAIGVDGRELSRGFIVPNDWDPLA